MIPDTECQSSLPARAKARQSENSPTDASIALIYVGLDDNERAMSWLNKAYQARFNPSILMRPVFDPLRSDPRFQDLLHRIGLPSRDRDYRQRVNATFDKRATRNTGK